MSALALILPVTSNSAVAPEPVYVTPEGNPPPPPPPETVLQTTLA